MIRHIVWWETKASNGKTAEENALFVIDTLKPIKDKIPSLLEMEFSVSFLSSSTEKCSFLLQTTHTNAQGLKDYADHPAHVACLDIIRPLLTNRRCLDYEIKA